MERKPYYYTHKPFLWGLFGGKKEQRRGNDQIEIIVELTEEEKEIIRRAPLIEHVIYDSPAHRAVYEESLEDWRQARQKRLSEGGGAGGYLGSKKEYKAYVPTLQAGYFLENTSFAFFLSDSGDMAYIATQNEIETNLRELKKQIDAIEKFPRGRKELDI